MMVMEDEACIAVLASIAGEKRAMVSFSGTMRSALDVIWPLMF